MNMPKILTKDYQSISDMAPVQRTVLGKNFYVQLAGKTNDAYQAFVQQLKDLGQVQVHFPEHSDYLVVFCPVVSRAGTDIGEALENIPGDKPTILVVMHHTFNAEYVVAESRREVDTREHPNILLTVDILFFNHRLLKCSRNSTAWSEVQKLLGVSPQVSSWPNYICNILKDCWCLLVVAGLVVSAVVIAIVLAVELKEE